MTPQYDHRPIRSSERSMAKVTYDKQLTALVMIDPYNDFISEGGKIWDRLKAVAEANNCVPQAMRLRKDSPPAVANDLLWGSWDAIGGGQCGPSPPPTGGADKSFPSLRYVQPTHVL